MLQKNSRESSEIQGIISHRKWANLLKCWVRFSNISAVPLLTAVKRHLSSECRDTQMDISTAPAVTWRDRNIYPLVVHSAKAGKKIQHVRGTSEKQDFSTGLPYVLPMKHHTKNQSDFFRPLHRGVFQAPAPLPLPLARYLPPTKEIHNSINESEMRQPKKKDIKTFSSWICWKGTHFNQTIFPPRLFYKKEKTLLKTPSVFCASLVQFPSKTHCECTLRGEGGTSWEFVPSELKTELPNARITGKPPFLAFGHWTGETNAIFDVFASESKRRSEETTTNPQVPVGHGYPLWTMLVSIYPFSKG